MIRVFLNRLSFIASLDRLHQEKTYSACSAKRIHALNLHIRKILHDRLCSIEGGGIGAAEAARQTQVKDIMPLFCFRTENLIIGIRCDLAGAGDRSVFHALVKMLQLFLRLLPVHNIFPVIDRIFHGNKMDIVFLNISVFNIDRCVDIDLIHFLIIQYCSSFLREGILIKLLNK